jgi:hypothetical protein
MSEKQCIFSNLPIAPLLESTVHGLCQNRTPFRANQTKAPTRPRGHRNQKCDGSGKFAVAGFRWLTSPWYRVCVMKLWEDVPYPALGLAMPQSGINCFGREAG